MCTDQLIGANSRAAEVRLDNGRTVLLRRLRLADLGTLIRWITRIGKLVDWADYDDLSPADAALKILTRRGDLAREVVRWLALAEPHAVQTWTLRDVLRVIERWLDVNEFDRLVEEGAERAAGGLEAANRPSRRGGSRTWSTT